MSLLTLYKKFSIFFVAVLLAIPLLAAEAQDPTSGGKGRPAPAPGVLDANEAAAILPATVFYRGQTATIQSRNSAGARLDGGALILATLVDTSGYSSALQQTYQAYLITEVTLQIGDHTLPAGAYGFGFIADEEMIVMDLGGHTLFKTKTTHDEAFRRPRPLLMLAAPGGSGYRLYLGRSFVTLTTAK
jgi:hypothetical protein